MGKESDRMELAFLTPLLKDGANCIGGGIAINNEGVFEMWLLEHWGCADSIHQGLKSGFVFKVPVETTTFGTMRNESIKRCSEHAEVTNIHAIKVEETEESSEFAKCCGSFPVFNTIDFDWVHSNTIFANDHPKVFDFYGFKLALLRFEVEVVVGEYLENIVDDATV